MSTPFWAHKKLVAQQVELEDPWCSYVGSKFMQWIGLPSSTFGETCKTDRYLHSIDSFFLVTNQDCILIIQNINFPKILCKPKLRWHFGIKCRCQLTFIFDFKNVTWHFGFEVERQIKFVKHRHCPAFCEFIPSSNYCIQILKQTCPLLC